MSVTVRPYRKTGGWEVDITVRLPNGQQHRERRKAPTDSKTAARKWGRERERHLAIHGLGRKRKESIPTLAEFWPRFISDHCEANRHKPSGIDSKQSAYRNQLAPLFRNKRLDAFDQADQIRLKHRMRHHKPSSVNNALTTWSQVLKCAVDWQVIDAMPVRIRLLKVQKSPPKLYDFDEYSWLLDAAGKLDPRIRLLILLGGDAGLRRGEIMALEQTDCDLRRGRITVQRSEWKGKVTETKGMEARVVPLTQRLWQALKDNEHLIGERVLYTDRHEPITAKVVQKWMARAQRRARLRASGGIHILRHTFCSHLAMKGAAAIAIQRLAGHQNLQTTLRYMHLAPGETDRAIRILESERAEVPARGEILETAPNVVPFPRKNN